MSKGEEALIKWAEKKLTAAGVEFHKVIEVTQDTYTDGYCDTCYYEEERMCIKYYFKENDPMVLSFWLYEEFSEILEEVLEANS